MSKKFKPIVVLDFDGVIHNYKSGWKGASVIPDEPVPGAIEFILEARKTYQVAILSSRSHQWGGKRAMKKWLRKWLIAWADANVDKDLRRIAALSDSPIDAFDAPFISYYAGSEPFYIAAKEWADDVINSISWPWFKPPAKITIDDRAIQFSGEFPEIEWIDKFKPWKV